MTNRENELKRFRQCLNTEDGQALMSELKKLWYDLNPIDPNPIHAGFNIALGEAYKQLKTWQEG